MDDKISHCSKFFIYYYDSKNVILKILSCWNSTLQLLFEMRVDCFGRGCKTIFPFCFAPLSWNKSDGQVIKASCPILPHYFLQKLKSAVVSVHFRNRFLPWMCRTTKFDEGLKVFHALTNLRRMCRYFKKKINMEPCSLGTGSSEEFFLTSQITWQIGIAWNERPSLPLSSVTRHQLDT